MKNIDRLTLEERVGQLFFLGFQGYECDAETRALFDRIRPGGVVFSQRNIENFDQTCNLTRQFVEFPAIPMLVAIEQEGGMVDRLKPLFAPLPSMQEAAIGGVAQVRLLGRIVASQLEATGFNTNFAPVLDLGAPGSILHSRTLSSDPAEVARLAAVYIEELALKGVLACGRHFPGMGAAPLDPYFVLPSIDKPRRQLLQEDVRPFADLADRLPLIMTGHARYPGIDDEGPASLSPRIVDGLLRRKLGFRGVIVTADLTMGAVHRVGLTPDLFMRALEAGNDMLLFSQVTPLVESAFRAIVKAARRSAVLRARIDQSLERIFFLKAGIRISSVRQRAHVRARILRQIRRIPAVDVDALPVGQSV